MLFKVFEEGLFDMTRGTLLSISALFAKRAFAFIAINFDKLIFTLRAVKYFVRFDFVQYLIEIQNFSYLFCPLLILVSCTFLTWLVQGLIFISVLSTSNIYDWGLLRPFIVIIKSLIILTIRSGFSERWPLTC